MKVDYICCPTNHYIDVFGGFALERKGRSAGGKILGEECGVYRIYR
jgi:hypothetical protein